MPAYGYTVPNPVYLDVDWSRFGNARVNALRSRQIEQQMDQANQLFPIQQEAAELGLDVTRESLRGTKAENLQKMYERAMKVQERMYKQIDQAFIAATPETASLAIDSLTSSLKIDPAVFRPIYDPKTGKVTQGRLDKFRFNMGVLTGRLKSKQQEEQEIRIAQGKKTPEKQWVINKKRGTKIEVDEATASQLIKDNPEIYELGQPISATKMSYDPSTGEVSFSHGWQGAMMGPDATVPPSKKTVNELQSNILENTKVMYQMQQVGENYKQNFLTLQGRLGNFGLTVLDYVGALPAEGDWSEWYQQRTDFEHATERLFNAYRKYITGAAASFQELERLRKSFLNTKLPPRKFEAAYNSYMTELQRLQQLYNRVVREGFSPDDNEKSQYNQRLNQLFTTKQKDDIEIRGPELDKILKAQYQQNANESPEQYQQRIDSYVRQQLRIEGYFNTAI